MQWTPRHHVRRPASDVDKLISVVLPTVAEDWTRVALSMASFDRFVDPKLIFAWYWIMPKLHCLVPWYLPPAGYPVPHVLLPEEELLDKALGATFDKSKYAAAGEAPIS